MGGDAIFEQSDAAAYHSPQAALVAIAGLEAVQGWYAPAVLTGLLGVFLTIQAQRVRCVRLSCGPWFAICGLTLTM
jgi:hypothetical protein